MPATDEILTTAEAMSFLRLPRATFYTALREGRLPAFRVGRQYRFRRSILLAWIEKQETKSHWRVPA